MSRYWTVWSATLLFFGAFYALLVPIPLYMEAIGLTAKLCPLWGRGIGHSAFWLSALLSLLASIVVWRVIPRGARRDLKIGHLVALPSPLRGPMLTTWLFSASFSALFAYLPLLAERRGFAPVGAAYGVVWRLHHCHPYSERPTARPP